MVSKSYGADHLPHLHPDSLDKHLCFLENFAIVMCDQLIYSLDNLLILVDLQYLVSAFLIKRSQQLPPEQNHLDQQRRFGELTL